MGEQFCISCSKILNKNHGKLIQETLLEILQVIFDNSNLEAQRGSKICESCEEKVMVAFRFKVRCIYTDDRLHPYISRRVENNERVDLKKVYAKERQCETPSYGYICRLCLELVEESDKNLLIDSLRNKNLEDKFNIYLPEVNLEVTKDPIICKRCLQSLGEFMSFRRFIKNISEIVPQKQLNNGDHFKDNKAIHINSAKEEECSDKQEQTRGNVANHIRSHTEWLKCKLCSYKSKRERDLKNHKKIHDSNAKLGPDSFERISESGMYKCKICLREFKTRGNVLNHLHSHIGWLKCKVCSYKSRSKRYLKNHEKIHGVPKIELKIHKCNKCEYRTVHKHDIRKHEQIHQDFNAKYDPDSMHSHTEIWFKCKLCCYKSKRETNVKKHEKIHDVSEIEQHLRIHEQNHHDFNAKDVLDSFEIISKSGLYRCKRCFREFKKRSSVANHMRSHTKIEYKCNDCEYKTKFKPDIRRHRWLNHSIVFQCHLCTFKTKYGYTFRNHHLFRHTIPVQYKCVSCSYKTTRIDHLGNHLKRAHPDTKIYKCSLCTYKTKLEKDLNRHMFIHKDNTEVKMYQCYNCGMKTKYKKCLQTHIEVLHTHIPEEKLYKCRICSFVTNYKTAFNVHMVRKHTWAYREENQSRN